MTVQSPPAFLQNASHSAALFRQASTSFVGTFGVAAAGELAVSQTATPSMAVSIGAGRAWIPGSSVSNVSGLTFSTQAAYFALNDASVTVTVAASDPTNPRIDVVYIAVNDSYYSGAANTAVLGVVTGVPAASPAAPAAPSNSVVLATVAVAAGSTTIVNGNIAQSQPLLQVGNFTPWIPLTLATGFSQVAGGVPTPRYRRVNGAIQFDGYSFFSGTVTVGATGPMTANSVPIGAATTGLPGSGFNAVSAPITLLSTGWVVLGAGYLRVAIGSGALYVAANVSVTNPIICLSGASIADLSVG